MLRLAAAGRRRSEAPFSGRPSGVIGVAAAAADRRDAYVRERYVYQRNVAAFVEPGSRGCESVRYGAVAVGEFFADREEELRVRRRTSAAARAWSVISPRRLGKTSLVERVIEILRREGMRALRRRRDRLPGRQRALLLALSREPGRVYAEAYRRRHKLGAASTVQAARAALERLDLVEPIEGGGQRLADIFLLPWLRRID